MSQRRSKILVIQWARLGDLFHSRPLCESALRVYHPAEITLSCDERYAAVAESFPEVDNVLPINLGGLAALARTDAMLSDLLHEVEMLASGLDADVVINLTNHVAAQTFAAVISAPQCLGYGNDESGLLNQLSLEGNESGDRKHVAHMWQSLVDLNSGLCYPRNLAPLKCADSLERVAVICSAGSAERSLTSETINAIVNAATAKDCKQVILIGSEQNTTSDLRSELVRDLRGCTTLKELRNVLCEASLVIGPDTGALHYAAALGKRVLGLYFAGAQPKLTGPLTKLAVCLTAAEQDESFYDEITHAIDALYNSNPEAEGKPRSDRELSIIVTEYAQTHYTDTLLELLNSCALPDNTEIIVMSSGVDSVDASFADARVGVRSDIVSQSRSFAGACNRGAMLATGRWLMFLNDDCELTNEAFQLLWKSRRSNEICGPRLLNWDGLIQSAGFTLEGLSVKDDSSGRWSAKPALNEIDGVSAAAMLVERRVFDDLAGFDESYQNGYEDVDFCLKAKQVGVRLRVTDCDVLHYQGSSPERFDHDDCNLALLRSKWLTNAQSPKVNKTPLARHAPLLFLSEEAAEGAGAVLRWRSPMQQLGLTEGTDFEWICTSEYDESAVFDCLSHSRAVVVFRSIQNAEIRRAVNEWHNSNGNVLLYDCDDLLIERFPQNSLRARQRQTYESAIREFAETADIVLGPNSIVLNQSGEVSGTRVLLETLPMSMQFSVNTVDRARETFNIGYAGSAVHQTDFASVAHSLLDLLESDSRARFFWWGAHPGELASHSQVRRGGSWVKNYETHIERVQRADIDLWIVPLSDSVHNAARSPIKAFEYIGAKTPCIFSNVLPFSELLRDTAPGLLVDNNYSSWLKAMRMWMEPAAGPELLKQLTTAREMLLQKSSELDTYNELLSLIGMSRYPADCLILDSAVVQ